MSELQQTLNKLAEDIYSTSTAKECYNKFYCLGISTTEFAILEHLKHIETIEELKHYIDYMELDITEDKDLNNYYKEIKQSYYELKEKENKMKDDLTSMDQKETVNEKKEFKLLNFLRKLIK